MGIRSIILAAKVAAVPPPSWGPYSAFQGSIVFSAANNSWLEFAGSSDWAVGTGDFTIEWWQWMTASSSNVARVFSVGTWPSASFALSIESLPLFWYNGVHTTIPVARSTFINSWHHIAICRAGGTTRFFLNGVQQGPDITASYNITDTSNALVIGNETAHDAAFDGWIANFHWVKGTAKYTSNFSLPVLPPAIISDSKLLLEAVDSSHTVTDATGNHLADVSDAYINWMNYSPFARTALLDMSNPSSAPTDNGVWTDLTSFGSNGSFIGNIAVIANDPPGGKSLDSGVAPAWIRFSGNNPLSTCSNKPPSATMNFWIKAQTSLTGYQFVGGARLNNSGMYFLLLPNGQTEARLGVGGGGGYFYDINVNYNSYYNSWHFVSFVAQPNRTDLYIDGVNVGHNAQVTGNFGTMPDFSIAGEAQNSGLNPFTGGQMGYCSVYDRSLSPDEVLAEYNTTKAYYGY